MSSFQQARMLIPVGVIYELNILATQPAGAPTPMGLTIDIPEGERGLFLGGFVGPDSYGAGRAITITLEKTVSANAIYTIAADTVDDQIINLGHTLSSITETSTTIGVIGLPYMPFLLTELMRIRISGASLASTETLTAQLFIATKIKPPDVAVFGAAVVLTTNTAIPV